MEPIKLNENALRIGWYSDKYFLRTQEILTKDNYNHDIHYQYFPRKDVVVCGIPHVLQILKSCTGYYENRQEAWRLFSELQKINPRTYSFIHEPEHELYLKILSDLDDLWVDASDVIQIFSVDEGYEAKDMEPVIGIVGNPKYFAHLETPTLGILSQQSAVATSVREVVKRLKPHQSLLFFPARFRHYVSQAPDGYAAVIGGAKSLSTDSNGEYWGYQSVGTIPHLLIAAYNGNTSLAALKFDEYIDPSINRIVLVDWNNDCIGATLCVVAAYILRYLKAFHEQATYSIDPIRVTTKPEYALHFVRDNMHLIKNIIGEGKGKIFGVRFDTSQSLVDKTFKYDSYKGVCPELVKRARYEFDEIGLHDLKIIVSGGFDLEKIDRFQSLNTPVDIFGIGSSIVNKFNVDFTADAVMLDGKPNAKVGRSVGDWSRLK